VVGGETNFTVKIVLFGVKNVDLGRKKRIDFGQMKRFHKQPLRSYCAETNQTAAVIHTVRRNLFVCVYLRWPAAKGTQNETSRSEETVEPWNHWAKSYSFSRPSKTKGSSQKGDLGV